MKEKYFRPGTYLRYHYFFLLPFDQTRYSGENLISQSQIRQGDLLTATVDRDRVEEVERQIRASQQVHVDVEIIARASFEFA